MNRHHKVHLTDWTNPICERVIGTLRRECLDHMIILNEKHLHDVLHEFIFEYYNISRTHMSLEKDYMVETLPAKCADDPFANWICLSGQMHLMVLIRRELLR